MSPSKQMLKLLQCFDERCPVSAASTILFGTEDEPVYRHPEIPGLIHEASQSGWLEDFFGKDQIPPPESQTKSGIAHVFFMDLELTASGREVCGLPPKVKPQPVITEKKKKGKPAKPPSPSLFGADFF